MQDVLRSVPWNVFNSWGVQNADWENRIRSSIIPRSSTDFYFRRSYRTPPFVYKHRVVVIGQLVQLSSPLPPGLPFQFLRSVEFTMAFSELPQEIHIMIIKNLRNDKASLKSCSSVSTSLVEPSQRLLFSKVIFKQRGPPLKSWTKAFPDSSHSPARYTHSLRMSEFTFRSIDELDHVCSFSNITKFYAEIKREGSITPQDFFSKLHGFSPNLKILHLHYPSMPLLGAFKFICSFPNLQGLDLADSPAEGVACPWDVPLTSPRFTWFLSLRSTRVDLIVEKLLDLPFGLHFSKIEVACSVKDIEPAKKLVSQCSDTLKSFCISCDPCISIFFFQRFAGALLQFIAKDEYQRPPSFDLSKATKVTRVKFDCGVPEIKWITDTLKTVTQIKTLKQITIKYYKAEGFIEDWHELDCLLGDFFTSNETSLKISTFHDFDMSLLPKTCKHVTFLDY